LILHTVLIVIAIVSLIIFDFVADRRLQALDLSALHEQGLIATIYDEIGQVRDLVVTYIDNPHPDTFSRFGSLSHHLRGDLATLAAIERGEAGERTVVDFSYMVQSFLDAASRTIDNRRTGALAEASDSDGEAIDILNLIHRQLTELFLVMNEDNIQQKKIADRVRDEILIIDIVLGLAIICLVSLFVGQVLRRILRPLDQLTKAAIDVNAGELKVRVKEGQQDFEIERLACAFNAMLTTIQQQIVELQENNELKTHLHEEELNNQRMRTLVKESELQALQSRINPHFLFNTLNMICQMAYSEDAKVSAALLEALSAMLRYLMADSSKPVFIDDEIANVQDYIYIQNLRFGERISFSLIFEKDIGSVAVPRLIIQPIVENAIKYGVKTLLRDAAITISVEPIEDMIRIRVADNGIGMDSERLAAVRASLFGPRAGEGGIGLRNIHERLGLFFGPRAELVIFSVAGEGTTVDLVIPRSSKALA
jgi:sensor histidine kinase YesM